MPKVRVEEVIAADPQVVWRIMSDFGGLKAWNPQIESCVLDGEGVGAVRTFAMTGLTIKERLESLDEAARTFSYAIIAGPLPATDYLATVQISDAGAGKTRILWTSDFVPAGAPESDLVALFEGIYRGGIKAVAKVAAAA
jgi:hypothetical protein